METVSRHHNIQFNVLLNWKFNRGVRYEMVVFNMRINAVVYAYNRKEAFKKLQSKIEIEEKDYSKWKVEELKSDSYDGVLYFHYKLLK